MGLLDVIRSASDIPNPFIPPEDLYHDALVYAYEQIFPRCPSDWYTWRATRTYCLRQIAKEQALSLYVSPSEGLLETSGWTFPMELLDNMTMITQAERDLLFAWLYSKRSSREIAASFEISVATLYRRLDVIREKLCSSS